MNAKLIRTDSLGPSNNSSMKCCWNTKLDMLNKFDIEDFVCLSQFHTHASVSPSNFCSLSSAVIYCTMLDLDEYLPPIKPAFESSLAITL